MIKQIFSFKGKLDIKEFTIALIASVAVYLLACWVLGFALTVIGLPLIAIKYVVALLAMILLARVVALVMRLLNK